MSNVKCLFVLKNSADYNTNYGTKKSSGLLNSAKFVSDMLNAAGISSQVEIVQDNNSIDKAVHDFQPTHVFIEALWVVPEKFDILVKLHPSVKWIVRIHSEIPFLAQDGVAIDWIKKYVVHPNVSVAANSKQTQEDLEIATGHPIIYLPNYYPVNFVKVGSQRLPQFGAVNISCFGAIRPLKDHLQQAIAALDFAHLNDLTLNFHINSSRVELDGGSVLKNLRALFAGGADKLIEHDWLEHDAFLQLVATMDLAMSVSFTETFSITTADAVAQAVPIVTSPEVVWSSKRIQASPTNTDDIVAKIKEAFKNRSKNIYANQDGLEDFSSTSRSLWLAYLGVRKKFFLFG